MRPHTLHKDIQKVVNAVDVLSETTYSINGILRDLSNIKLKLDNGDVLSNTASNKASFFKNILKTDIYNQLYKADVDQNNNVIEDLNHTTFLSELSKANNGTGTWEDKWVIVGKEQNTDNIIVSKQDIKFWVAAHEVISSNGSYLPNTPCLVKIGKEVKNLNTSFYMAFGNINKEQIENFENQLTRFYWNLTPKGAIRYIKLITHQLNAASICFRTKVLSNSQSYDRPDAGVLYLDKSQLTAALPILTEIYTQLKPFLKYKTPLFTKPLGKGFSFAEDPQNGMSFGISRAEMIGNTLYNCYQMDIRSKKEIAHEMYTTFYEQGIHPFHPYSSIVGLNDYEQLLNALNLN
ncbi:T3SS effector HopA1 family protein [Aureispira anguillae]|uniref:T3SS effector HopA1 family protein n=1 Tax=Aureispira anguillae TaxID=2864201 RepID=A0A916DX72_9BACT|nr:T3SS effector HopA1 family protein [Aureispira anguillae]BDS14771.1 T3SS effector HopA1 family protein [Aureispira anguillae]